MNDDKSVTSENRILVVDDDVEICELLESYLKKYSYSAICCTEPLDVVNILKIQTVDLILLDKNMPKLDGIELTTQIRTFSNVPIIMMTASDDDNDRITALEMNINAYIAKPFSLRVIIALITAVLRRDKMDHEPLSVNNTVASLQFQFDGWILDCVKKVLVSDKQRPIELSSMEFDLLHTLVLNAGKIISRDELIKATQTNLPLGVNDRRIDVMISKLRTKLSLELGKRLKSVRNAGYIFNIDVTPI